MRCELDAAQGGVVDVVRLLRHANVQSGLRTEGSGFRVKKSASSLMFEKLNDERLDTVSNRFPMSLQWRGIVFR